MLGIAERVPEGALRQGQRHKPATALEVGIVDELASTPEEMLDQARAWIAAERRRGRAALGPAEVPDPRRHAVDARSSPPMLPAFPANLRKQLKGAPMPAPRNILAAAVEGTQVDFDTALRIETPATSSSWSPGRSSKNMTKAFFFDMQAINGGASRPAGYDAVGADARSPCSAPG